MIPENFSRCENDHLVPEYYEDNSMPPGYAVREAQAEALPRGSEERHQAFAALNDLYVHWLADYLITAPLTISPEQEAWLAQVHPRNRKDVLGICLAASAGAQEYGSTHDSIEGLDFEQYLEKRRVDWLRDSELYSPYEDSVVPATPIPEAKKPYWIMKPETFARMQRENQQRAATGKTFEHLDMPFRGLLARVFRDIPSHDQRVKLLRNAYGVYNEEVRK